MVEYSVALTSQPWTLPIDALVMSVGGGLGRLAWAVDAEYPAARLRYSGFESATPDKPVLRELRARGTTGAGPWLAVLATPHDGIVAVTLESVDEATTAAVRAAAGRRALRIGMPMIATGSLGKPYETVAEVAQRITEAQLDEVVTHIGALGRQLAELEPGRHLYSFLAERIASETYTGRLGLVSTIRKDFEQLVTLLADARSYEGAGTGDPGSGRRVQPVERIVLYIDDLDRCSPRQVAEVLQAVHLLLALDLFVVVLGVDPRWLLNSLGSHYHALLETASDGSGQNAIGRATPEDYLEKIINIPVALPRMPKGTFGLMASAMAGSPKDGAAAQHHAGTDAAPGSDSTARGPAQSGPTASGLTVEPGSAIAQQQLRATPSPELRPLSEAEIEVLGRLDSFAETPRQAKRLINLYRMLRSTRDLSGSSRFLGEDGEPGDYQAVVVLLGIISFRPRMLDPVLDALLTFKASCRSS